MAFSEKVHAFISVKYYAYLKEKYADRGIAAFKHAVTYYGLQRGRRMAQRAIRDGQPLTQASYNYYGEFQNSKEAIEEGCANQTEILPDGKMKITVCPWYEQFKKMGILEAGIAYCEDLDQSISRGFNPKLGYTVTQTLNESDYCIHYLKSGKINETGDKVGKNPLSLKSFEYHCAHLYYAYAECIKAIFGYEAEEICAQVLKDIASEYGQEYANTIEKYRDANFNVCD